MAKEQNTTGRGTSQQFSDEIEAALLKLEQQEVLTELEQLQTKLNKHPLTTLTTEFEASIAKGTLSEAKANEYLDLITQMEKSDLGNEHATLQRQIEALKKSTTNAPTPQMRQPSAAVAMAPHTKKKAPPPVAPKPKKTVSASALATSAAAPSSHLSSSASILINSGLSFKFDPRSGNFILNNKEVTTGSIGSQAITRARLDVCNNQYCLNRLTIAGEEILLPFITLDELNNYMSQPEGTRMQLDLSCKIERVMRLDEQEAGVFTPEKVLSAHGGSMRRQENPVETLTIIFGSRGKTPSM